MATKSARQLDRLRNSLIPLRHQPSDYGAVLTMCAARLPVWVVVFPVAYRD